MSLLDDLFRLSYPICRDGNSAATDVATVGISASPVSASHSDCGGIVDTENNTDLVGTKRGRRGGRGNGTKQM